MNAAPHATVGAALTRAIASPKDRGGPAIVAFITAGYPSPEAFPDLLRAVSAEADVVEVGIPFSDPMADGATIQRSSRLALERGATPLRAFEAITSLHADGGLQAPIVVMSYLNPLISLGAERLASLSAEAGVAGLIVPDLPIEESDLIAAPLREAGVALVQMVTPVTPEPRLRRIARQSQGFLYAVTVAGTTGGTAPDQQAIRDYLAAACAVSPVPVCAGFGIRTPEQVAALRGHADGVIVGSALIDAIERGDDPAAFLRSLRPQPASLPAC